MITTASAYPSDKISNLTSSNENKYGLRAEGFRAFLSSILRVNVTYIDILEVVNDLKVSSYAPKKSFSRMQIKQLHTNDTNFMIDFNIDMTIQVMCQNTCTRINIYKYISNVLPLKSLKIATITISS